MSRNINPIARERPGSFEGVIFDMDGTLIEPLLDFGAIRRDLGIAPDEGILEAIQALPPERSKQAAARLLGRELAAARSAALLPGTTQTLSAIRAAGLKTALLTRNAAEAMQIVLERFKLEFDLAWSREDGPIKPEPVGVLAACRTLGIQPARTVCVGDYHYDLVAANRAGAVSVLLVQGARPAFADEADFVIRALPELLELLGI